MQKKSKGRSCMDKDMKYDRKCDRKQLFWKLLDTFFFFTLENNDSKNNNLKYLKFWQDQVESWSPRFQYFEKWFTFLHMIVYNREWDVSISKRCRTCCVYPIMCCRWDWTIETEADKAPECSPTLLLESRTSAKWNGALEGPHNTGSSQCNCIITVSDHSRLIPGLFFTAEKILQFIM